MKFRCIFFSFLILASFAQAEEPRIGRLSDGRAYRISPEGYRMVDELAELEVLNDELHRQMITLETQIDEQKTEIRKLRAAANSAKQEPDSFELPESPSCETTLESLKHEREDLIRRLARAENEMASGKQPTAARSRLTENHSAVQTDELSAELMKNLADVRGSLKVRDSLYAQLKQKNKNVEVHLKDPRSESGKSLEMIAAEIKSHISDPALMAELEQIRKQVRDDILLLRRLGSI